MKFERVTVTPELARKMLDQNQNNRAHIRWASVSAMAAEMKRGEWKLNHQPIAFDEDGLVLDGQHRLHAIERSGATIELIVCTGAPRDSFNTLDRGIKRSLADLTGINPRIAEALRIFCRCFYDDPQTRNGYVSPARLTEINEIFGPDVRALQEFCPRWRGIFATAPVRAAAAMRAAEAGDTSYAWSMYKSLNESQYDGLPPIAQAFVSQAVNGTLSARYPMDIFARAWRVFDEGYANISKLVVKDIANAINDAHDVLIQIAAERAMQGSLNPGQEKIVRRRMREIATRKGKSAELFR